MFTLVLFLIAFVGTSVCFFLFYQLPQSLRGLASSRRRTSFREGKLRVYHPANNRHRVNKHLLRKAWAE